MPEFQMEFRLIENEYSRNHPAKFDSVINSEVILNAHVLVLIPSLGCNGIGHRLGRGGGYYDRWKKTFDKCLKVGILPTEVTGIDFPAEKHDIRLDLVITDKGILDFR
jgi:5-formyltetrahydrofolate cyclo-ligase